MQIETAPSSAGPFAHARTSIQRTMSLVMLALLPATLFGFWQFGWPAIFLFFATLSTAVLAEAVCLRIAGKPQRQYLLDGSALLAGWILAVSLPPWAPWWIGAIGALLAVVVAKQVFGGLGQNLFNPAMVARVALLISFPLEMTNYVQPMPLFSADAPGFLQSVGISLGQPGFDAVSGATLLSHVRTELSQGLTLTEILPDMGYLFSGAVGTIAGSMGETSALLILLGGLFLLVKRVITWHTPVAMIGSLAILATLMNLYDPEHYAGALYHVVSGATLLVAFFIATDPVTSPVSKTGQIIFGAGCGVLVYVIRTWAGYPEGVAFAILLMNACTPMIDHYVRPRVYGRDRRGTPIEYADNAEMRK
ncbi:RnfABCDGE type electron transport complex subunit D [Thiocapsa marina]|uniref:Ion-translocating oxidoreductase complex subunit D n=1 Tax=Thiocapsa marina 5811 TaxID=768671 RepID=F9UE32_9GAMM|nr:RnfABCDGE type electron transport complex subunit D [Thiocapsa marina]EGV17589.1 Electron transport complex protein rnfD [Thiocapsa marina 5811]